MMSNSALYDRDILRLAASLYRWPLDDAFERIAEKRSPVCGSTIRLGFDRDAAGRISRIGLDVQACALGQASAAIVAANALGLSQEEAELRAQQCRDLLDGNVCDAAELWPDMTLLSRAAPYPARHGAIMLPYEALSSAFADTPTETENA
ncbi:MAG: iron-sulfur cluster assembly scaffold protein [Pseudomonadota bacterium]